MNPIVLAAGFLVGMLIGSLGGIRIPLARTESTQHRPRCWVFNCTD